MNVRRTKQNLFNQKVLGILNVFAIVVMLKQSYTIQEFLSKHRQTNNRN